MPRGTFKEIISERAIAERVQELGKQISDHYAHYAEGVVAVCVLKGAFIFYADLVRALDFCPALDFVRLASYGHSKSRQDRVLFTKDMEISVADKHVLIVEDIVDTGHSIDYLSKVIAQRKPKTVKICALIDKPERREIEVQVDFSGFYLPEGFIVGYGLDYAEQYRQLRAIYELG